MTPFSFESFARRKNAEECIDDLLPIADIVMRIPNDLLFSMLPSETPFEEAFAKSCEELARSATGICGLLNCENSLDSDYAGFMAMLKGKKCSCGLGVGCAENSEGLDRCGIAVERMLESPFLGGSGKLENADAAIVTVTGGADLQIGEIKRTLEIIGGLLPKTASVLTGVNVGSTAEERLQVTVICIKYEQLPQPARRETAWTAPVTEPPQPSSAAEAASVPLEQGVFELQIFNKGAFVNVAPTLFKGEDLDIPTYQRREANRYTYREPRQSEAGTMRAGRIVKLLSALLLTGGLTACPEREASVPCPHPDPPSPGIRRLQLRKSSPAFPAPRGRKRALPGSRKRPEACPDSASAWTSSGIKPRKGKRPSAMSSPNGRGNRRSSW